MSSMDKWGQSREGDTEGEDEIEGREFVEVVDEFICVGNWYSIGSRFWLLILEAWFSVFLLEFLLAFSLDE